MRRGGPPPGYGLRPAGGAAPLVSIAEPAVPADGCCGVKFVNLEDPQATRRGPSRRLSSTGLFKFLPCCACRAGVARPEKGTARPPSRHRRQGHTTAPMAYTSTRCASGGAFGHWRGPRLQKTANSPAVPRPGSSRGSLGPQRRAPEVSDFRLSTKPGGDF